MSLREIVAGDAEDMHVLRSDETVMQYIGRPRSQAPEDARELIHQIQTDQTNHDGITWGIQLKNGTSLIGTIGLYRLKKEHYRAEIGYMLSPDAWGQGLMTEAIQKILEYSFLVLGFHSIEADTDPENSRSRSLLERNGFRLEGTLRECFHFEDKFYDANIYSILKSEFR